MFKIPLQTAIYLLMLLFIYVCVDGRLPSYSDATLSNLHNPKIIMLFQHFHTQTTESKGDANKVVPHLSLEVVTVLVVQSKICFSLKYLL